ncbi:hypothetical protein [Flavobacterium branchiicola]|uniref:Type II toxin-antitoxin system RelE/ParE family toxin n=1 Tax=Flavobacterium branchiicola TaxID=1114875 RepID=A0ABV9P9V6_9FLAO|nr:hypothetical protein [Flavobacterium branchiicola]MBS7252579.1 hypothetical protein [Flavobacterium branchiicola]
MVGEIEVVFTPKVLGFLDDLVIKLYKKEYFGFLESAENYVLTMYDAIPDRIKKTRHSQTPNSIKYLGTNYIFYKANNRTTWYIFFEKRERNYLITAIVNNNSIEVKYL